MKSGFESVRFEFKKDGSLTMGSTIAQNTKTGKWTVKGEVLDIKIDDDKSTGEKPVFTLNADRSKIHMSQKGEMGADMDLVRTP